MVPCCHKNKVVPPHSPFASDPETDAPEPQGSPIVHLFPPSFLGAPTEEGLQETFSLVAHAGGPKPTFVHRIATAYPIYRHHNFYQLN